MLEQAQLSTLHCLFANCLVAHISLWLLETCLKEAFVAVFSHISLLFKSNIDLEDDLYFH